jgi:hypothetical protein
MTVSCMIDSLPDGLSGDEVAELMGAAASHAAGYEVLVEAKRVLNVLAVD